MKLQPSVASVFLVKLFLCLKPAMKKPVKKHITSEERANAIRLVERGEQPCDVAA